MKFLTKSEIIEKLQSLPDLPVVIEVREGTLDCSLTTSIQVVRATRQLMYDYGREYYVYEESEKGEEDVILIKWSGNPNDNI